MSAELPRRTLLASTAVAASAPLLAACTDLGQGRQHDKDGHDPATTGGDALITNALVFDGERFTEHDSVLVQGGLIAEIGQGLAVDGTPVFDCGGRVLLPGLIDAHTHQSFDLAESALRFGVTAMLDMHGRVAPITLERRRSLDERTAADVWWADWGLTVPEGHGTQYGPGIPSIEGVDDVGAFIADRAESGADHIKLIIQKRHFPATLSQEQATAGAHAAHQRGMLAVAHVGDWEDTRVAVTAGVDVLVHLPVDLKVDEKVVDMLAQRGIPVVATMHVTSAGRCAHDPAGFVESEDPVGVRLDRRQRRDAADTPEFCYESTEEDLAEYRTYPEASLAALRAAGVTILVGTDTPNPGVVAGLSMYAEMQMLAEGGLSTVEILSGATSRTADVFGLHERGRIAPGKRGDMVLLDAAEPEDVIGTYAVEAVWKNGHPVDLEAPN